MHLGRWTLIVLALHAGRGVAQQDAPDAARMAALLEEMAAMSRSQRVAVATVSFTGATALGAMGGYSLWRATEGGRGELAPAAAIGLGSAAVYAGIGLFAAFRHSDEERIFADFDRERRAPGADLRSLLEKTEERLEQLAERDRSQRLALEITSYALAGVAVAGMVGAEAWVIPSVAEASRGDARVALHGYLGTLAAFAVMSGLLARFTQTPTEHFVNVWRKQSGIQDLQVGLAPTPGGLSVGLSGRF